MNRRSNLLRLAGGVLASPRLLGPALRAAWRFRARGWHRRPPFLPLPPSEYLEWRLHTAYGEEGDGPEPAELERYLHWSERMLPREGRRVKPGGGPGRVAGDPEWLGIGPGGEADRPRLAERAGGVRLAARLLYGLGLGGFLALAVWLATIELDTTLTAIALEYGYAGYVAAAGIAGLNVFVPTTHMIFTEPLLDAGLRPWPLAACGALGATLGDLLGYVLGSGGREVASGWLERLARRLADAVRDRPRAAPAVLFLWAAFAPLPNEVLVIPAGAIGYGIARTTLITFGGNVVFNVLAVALALSLF